MAFELVDARLLLPESIVFRDDVRGTFATFSDLLRYELLAADCRSWRLCRL